MELEERFRPEFDKSLLHPRYWPVWLGFGLLAFIVNILPYSALRKLGRGIGVVAMRFAKRRAHVVERNLELAFPEMNADERSAFVVENFKNTGMAIIETGIGWYWPDWRFARIIKELDVSALKKHAENNQGTLLCCTHALSLEVLSRSFAHLGYTGYGVYRPHSNKAYDYIQNRRRTLRGNGIIDRTDLKKIVRMLKTGKRVWYLADHDYGHHRSVFVPFFNVEQACTTTGPTMLIKMSKCAVVMGSAFRNEDGIYEVIANTSIENEYPVNDPVEAAKLMNHHIESVIMKAPEQWMWTHKRFKSVPDETKTNSRYQ